MINKTYRYKYTGISKEKEFVVDYLEAFNCKNMSEACKFLEDQGYEIFSIDRVEPVYALDNFNVNPLRNLTYAYLCKGGE